jgi:hypothetical protein
MNAGPDRCGGNDGERCRQREVIIQRFDPGRADEGGQRKGGLQHGEVVADTGPRSAAERQVLRTRVVHYLSRFRRFA